MQGWKKEGLAVWKGLLYEVEAERKGRKVEDEWLGSERSQKRFEVIARILQGDNTSLQKIFLWNNATNLLANFL